jgi:dTDP-4-amino-4,6-dideoxygalactose transaminase
MKSELLDSSQTTVAPPPRVYLSPPQTTGEDRDLLLDAFDSGWIAPLGPHVDAFEEEFASMLGVPCAVALSSGTAALHLALAVCGIGPGDEVATSTLTFVASANAIRYVGAVPVFIDSEAGSWNMDPKLLAEELEASVQRGRPIKAVLAVDVLGQCADYARITELCHQYDVPLIEDAAEALGATYDDRPAGTFGDIGCFSFNGNKIITTSGGGMLVTARREWAEKARWLATQARDPAAHYEHSKLGFNYRLSNLLAALGRGQLRVLEERVAQRRAIFAAYKSALEEAPGIDFMPEHPRGRCTRWLTCLTIDPNQFGATSEAVRMALEEVNIESRPVWKPMHLQPLYAGCRVRGGGVSERLFERGLCLPSGSDLQHEVIQRIVEVIYSVRPRPRHAK